MGSAIDLYEQAPWYEYAIQLPGYLHPTSLQAYSSTLFALRASGLGDHITCGGLRCFDRQPQHCIQNSHSTTQLSY